MEEPTRKDNVRKDNILDLILTNRPSKVLRVDVLTGDDIVFTVLDKRPVKQRQNPRQVPLYRKADWEPMKEDMRYLYGHMEAMFDLETRGVNEMWKSFRDIL